MNVNLPGDRVHHIKHSFCRLVIPWTRGRWIAYTLQRFATVIDLGSVRRPIFVLVSEDGFHNCRRFGR